MGFTLGNHCEKRMFMYIRTHTYVYTEKYFVWNGNFLEDCVAYSLRLLVETGRSLWQAGISSNFKPGAGFKSSLIFCVQPKGQVCLSSGLLWWLGILFPTALPQVLYWSCIPLRTESTVCQSFVLLLMLITWAVAVKWFSAALWGTKITASRLLKEWVGLCLQCGSQQFGGDKAPFLSLFALPQNNLP